MVSGRRNPLFFGIAARLQQCRRQAGLKLLPMAQKAGLATATGRDIEQGIRLPTIATVVRLAVALEVSAAWLAYGIGNAKYDEQSQSSDGMGARLSAMRTERQLSRAALARLCNLSPRAIAKIESGGQSGIDIMETLAKALGVSPGWLAFGVGPLVLESPRRGRPPAQSSTPVD